MKIEVRLFNKLRKYSLENKNGFFYVSLPEDSKINDLIETLQIPKEDIYLIMRNGRAMDIKTGFTLRDGDRIAFSGPIPYNRFIGSPVI